MIAEWSCFGLWGEDVQAFPTGAAQPLQEPEPRDPSPNRSRSGPLGPEGHSLPRHCSSRTHLLMLSARAASSGDSSHPTIGLRPSLSHWLPSSSSPRPSPPSTPSLFFSVAGPLAFHPELVSSSKGVRPPHVSPRSATHFLQLLSHLELVGLTSCCGAKTRAASDWLLITMVS